jgi:DNA-binding LacI/PurR family transcriptional regulator
VSLASLAPGAPPTLADVARLAGVSAATASRVLSGSAHVQPKTREKVEQAVARLGYVRNRAARAVRSQQAGSIALVVGEESVRSSPTRSSPGSC